MKENDAKCKRKASQLLDAKWARRDNILLEKARCDTEAIIRAIWGVGRTRKLTLQQDPDELTDEFAAQSEFMVETTKPLADKLEDA